MKLEIPLLMSASPIYKSGRSAYNVVRAPPQSCIACWRTILSATTSLCIRYIRSHVVSLATQVCMQTVPSETQCQTLTLTQVLPDLIYPRTRLYSAWLASLSTNVQVPNPILGSNSLKKTQGRPSLQYHVLPHLHVFTLIPPHTDLK